MMELQSYYVELRASKQELEIFHIHDFQQVIANIKWFNQKPDIKN